MKILINTPKLDKLGGVSNHYTGLKKYWRNNVVYNQIGRRFYIPGFFLLPFDIIFFIIKLLMFRPELVVLNPSLNQKAYFRDSIYLKVSKLLQFKVVVFFHGWDKQFEKKITKKSFIKSYGVSDSIIILAKEFKNKIRHWGYNNPIFLTTTKVDDKLLKGFTYSPINNKLKVIFFARITYTKGVYIAMDVFTEFQKLHPKATLDIIGDGPELKKAINYASSKEIKNIVFHGQINGENLKQILSQSNINLFPTNHGEGMPTTILESMAFGHVIITKLVGGLKDFFKSNQMGWAINSDNKDLFLLRLMELAQNTALIDKIGKLNYKYAKDNFYASKVASKLESIFEEISANK